MELFDDEIEEPKKQPVQLRILGGTARCADDDDEGAQLPDWYMEWYVPKAIRYCIEHSYSGQQDEPVEGPFLRIDGQVSTNVTVR